MAATKLVPGLLLASAYIVYRLVSSRLAARRFQSFADQHGCKPPKDISKSYPELFRLFRTLMNLENSGLDLLDDIVSLNFEDGAFTAQGTQADYSTTMVTIEPLNLQAMLATQFKDFETQRYDVFKPLLGRSIFSSDGAFWEHSRALFRPQFARDNINDLDATNQASRELFDALGPTSDDGWTEGCDMMPLIYSFTLDTATHFLFGKSIEAQAAASALRETQDGSTNISAKQAEAVAAAKRFSDSIPLINDMIIRRVHLQSLWILGDSFAFRKAIRHFRDFIEPFVQLAVTPDPSKQGSRKHSLLDNLATQTQDRTELRNQTTAILLAGRDTTAAFLAWCFVRLALHPEIFTKLRTIILSDFGPSSTTDDDHSKGEEITFAKLKSCRYLQHFLNEVLRLHPVVPYNGRRAARDTTLPLGGGPDQKSPIAIRKGQLVAFNVYHMHRREELWGEDAAEFKPERWSERIPAWQFLPFLGGPRVCLGQQFALTEAGFLLVRFLQTFDRVEPLDWTEMRRLRKGYGVTLWPGDGCRVRWRRAGASE